MWYARNGQDERNLLVVGALHGNHARAWFLTIVRHAFYDWCKRNRPAEIEVASSDQHTVKPWLSARLDYSPPVRDLANDGFALTEGRLDTLDRQPIATLVYRYRQHTIDVFVCPSRPMRRRPHYAPCAASMSRTQAAPGWIGSRCPTSVPTFCLHSSSGSRGQTPRPSLVAARRVVSFCRELSFLPRRDGQDHSLI